MIAVLLGTFVGDTAAYLGGRAFGTRPLAPRVSPNKTVEGLAFGIVGARAGRLVVRALPGLDGRLERAPARRSASACSAPIGDLFESKIKRDAGTKDAGTLFGAHGGALDRLDAAFFTLVAGYYLWLLLYDDRDDQTGHVEQRRTTAAARSASATGR